MSEPISVDDPHPFFCWQAISGERGVVTAGYELEISRIHTNGSIERLWGSGPVDSNQTQFVPYPVDGPVLVSNSDYSWKVRSSSPDSEWSESQFSTGLLQQSDWAKSEWIQKANESSYASQMRKEFTLPAGTISRASAFVALPGAGHVWINGQKVDGRAGTRSRSQYDVRTLYHTYDIQQYLQPDGQNTIAVLVSAGWFGHPAHPPQAERFPFGPPTLRLLLKIDMQSTEGSAPTHVEVGTDASWTETEGPVVYADIYNGMSYDARLETPGWTQSGFQPSASDSWAAVKLSASQASFELQKTTLSAATFPAVEVLDSRQAKTMRMPSPGIYVYDFEQNKPGWCVLRIAGQRGLRVQLRHAEILQHPPYGPFDGSIYVDNLRSAKATDLYVLKGDPKGEEVEFSLTLHGFRYVELSFPGSANAPPPSLGTLEAAYVRSAMKETGALTVSNNLLQQVHSNIKWGQASNLIMIPTDCDNRDERFGWGGDSALTADEAALNFDMGAFYHNWLRMIDDTSQYGAVSQWLPGSANRSSPHAGATADAAWGSVFPSVAWALYKWNGDTMAPTRYWEGLSRFMDNEFNITFSGNNSIRNVPAKHGDWKPPPVSSSNPQFKPEQKVEAVFSEGFAFVHDLGHMAQMASALGGTKGAAAEAKYSAMYAHSKKAFHEAYFNEQNQWYEQGGQTAQVLALKLDRTPPSMMTPAEKAAVIAHLVANVRNHSNHTTSGIIGWRYEAEVLSENGHADLAFALMTQTTYPSFGYEILNSYEPATTLWEIWNGDTSGPHIDSRNHIMFGGPGVWLHTYVGGITNAPGSIGYEHVMFAPPAQLIRQALGESNEPSSAAAPSQPPQVAQEPGAPLKWGTATREIGRGTFALFWSLEVITGQTCVESAAGTKSSVVCSHGGIKTVKFADYGTPLGDCTNELRRGNCTTGNLTDIVTSVCVGQESCTIDCYEVYGRAGDGCIVSTPSTTKTFPLPDPCHHVNKRVALEVACNGSETGRTANLSIRSSAPANSIATTAVPLLGADPGAVTVSEGGTVLWRNGAYVPGVDGVTGAATSGDVILVSHGSGTYDFSRVG
eukprot:g370.t1